MSTVMKIEGGRMEHGEGNGETGILKCIGQVGFGG